MAVYFATASETLFTFSPWPPPGLSALLSPRAPREKECFSKVLDAARAPTFDLFQECMDIVNAIEPATFAALKSIPLPFWTHHASPGHTVILDQVSSHAKELTSGVLDSEVRPRLS